MSAPGWTDGAWRFEPFREKDHSYARDALSGGVIRDEENREIAVVEGFDVSFEEAFANGTLLGAVKDLYAACELIAQMAEVLRAGSHTPQMLNATRHMILRDAANAADKARAALQKAQGDS